VLWDKAHNVYLENALELGVPAMAALNLAIALLAVEALRGLWRRRRERTAPAIGVAATVLVGLHSFFDFSLQMPAVAVFYAFLMGLAVAQAWPQARGRTG
jgi:O-antigen ligase